MKTVHWSCPRCRGYGGPHTRVKGECRQHGAAERLPKTVRFKDDHDRKPEHPPDTAVSPPDDRREERLALRPDNFDNLRPYVQFLRQIDVTHIRINGLDEFGSDETWFKRVIL